MALLVKEEANGVGESKPACACLEDLDEVLDDEAEVDMVRAKHEEAYGLEASDEVPDKAALLPLFIISRNYFG